MKRKSLGDAKVFLIFFVTAAITALILIFVVPGYVSSPTVAGGAANLKAASSPSTPFNTDLLFEVLLSFVIASIVTAIYVISKRPD